MSGTWKLVAPKIEVAVITTKDGQVFYNDSHGPDVMREIMKRCDWQSIVRVEMDINDYNAIPTTNEAAQLFAGIP